VAGSAPETHDNGAMTTIAVRFLVDGLVQGVGFRAATRVQARVLGLRGRAINLADGRVEVLAIGPADAVDALGRWLAHGPPGAQVDEVERHAATDSGSAGFTIG
jgi:acylphosphatase